MTLAAIEPRILITGTGTLGPFSLSIGGAPLRFTSNGHIRVTRYSAAGVGTVLVEGTDYTLTGGPNAGSLILTSPQTVLLSTERLLIERVQPFAQDLALGNAVAFPSSSVEARLDKLTEFVQDLNARVGRAVTVHPTDASGVAFAAATDRALKSLAFDGSGNLIATSGVAGSPGVPVSTPMQAVVASSTTDEAMARANAVVELADVATLRAKTWTAAARPDAVLVRQSWAAGDGGGVYRLDSADTTSLDNGGTIIVDAATNRWKRLASRVFNVRDFGADNTGATDAIAAFDAAAAAANAAGGGVVFVPAGSYRWNSRFLFPGSNIHLLGESAAASIILGPTSGTLSASWITADSKNDISVSNLQIDMQERATTSNAHPALLFVLCNDFTVSDCIVRKWTAFGIGVNGGSRGRIERNFVERTASIGSYPNHAINISQSAGAATGHRVVNNYCLRSGTIFFGNSHIIEHNVVESSGYGAGIVTGPATASGVVVASNICRNGTGVDIDGTYIAGMEINTYYTLVCGNICNNNHGAGIVLFGGSSLVSGNLCYANGVGAGANDDTRSGITAAYASASATASRSAIIGNRCFDTGGGGQKFGIRTNSSSLFEIELANNNLANNATGPVSLSGSQISTPSIQYEASAAFSPGTLANGAYTSTAITVAGAAFGDAVVAGYSADLLGCTVTAHVSASNSVRIAFHNATGGSVALGSGTVYVRLFKRLAV